MRISRRILSTVLFGVGLGFATAYAFDGSRTPGDIAPAVGIDLAPGNGSPSLGALGTPRLGALAVPGLGNTGLGNPGLGTRSLGAPDLHSPLTSFQAFQSGTKALRAGDTQAGLSALEYASTNGHLIATWKLGRMYAEGDGVKHDDLRAFDYFRSIADSHADEASDGPQAPFVANAFVALGTYYLDGIPNSTVKPDADRAREMFSYAAIYFGDRDAQYNLARMYLDGAAGLAKDNMRAARWFQLAADRGHHGAQALLGHLLFTGDGVPSQRARGLMWLWIAKSGAKGPNDTWIHDLQTKDYNAASDDDREVCQAYLGARGKELRELTGAPRPPAIAAPPMRLSGAIAPVGATLPATARPGQ